MIRRKKTTIFLDSKETTSVLELKKMVEGITKIAPDYQRLYTDDQVMDNNKTLGDYNLNSSTAKAQAPATVGLAYRDPDSGKFEPLEITVLSNPPELPDVMKTAEPPSHEQTWLELLINNVIHQFSFFFSDLCLTPYLKLKTVSFRFSELCRYPNCLCQMYKLIYVYWQLSSHHDFVWILFIFNKAKLLYLFFHFLFPCFLLLLLCVCNYTAVSLTCSSRCSYSTEDQSEPVISYTYQVLEPGSCKNSNDSLFTRPHCFY